MFGRARQLCSLSEKLERIAKLGPDWIVLTSFATGITVISTITEDGDHGMTAIAFMSILLDRKSRMRQKVRASGRYAVGVLSHDMEHIALHFAGRHNPELERIFERHGGLPAVPGAAAVFLAEVEQEIDAGIAPCSSAA